MGVWIETLITTKNTRSLIVTPFVGVWIETIIFWLYYCIARSHPSWVCGLKLPGNGENHLGCSVTPFVGVWIETVKYFSFCIPSCHTLRGCVDWNRRYCGYGESNLESHPSWVCGLKRHPFRVASSKNKSHPSWVCGLKLNLLWHNVVKTKSHPSWVCGLKHALLHDIREYFSHTLRGCVDWNLYRYNIKPEMKSHTLRGCVDWNIMLIWKHFGTTSHTLRGCVDWNLMHKV